MTLDNSFYYPEGMYNEYDLKEVLEKFVDSQYDTTAELGYNDFKARMYKETFTDNPPRTFGQSKNQDNGLGDMRELFDYIQTFGCDYYIYLDCQIKLVTKASYKFFKKEELAALRDVLLSVYYLGSYDERFNSSFDGLLNEYDPLNGGC